MITGAHTILYGANPEADRAFFRDILTFPNVDAGHGWLIFALPPSEIAIHASGKNDLHEFYLMSDDVESLIAEMKAKGVECGALQRERWGLLTHVELPGGGKVGVYQQLHPRPV